MDVDSVKRYIAEGNFDKAVETLQHSLADQQTPKSAAELRELVSELKGALCMAQVAKRHLLRQKEEKTPYPVSRKEAPSSLFSLNA
ncbi:MAG TPA: hypothetical protein VEQ63_16305 [Bryobacteraceae bacterium]|nr:hypothetical protein [Bryobacteraceae bacterium]